MEKQTILIVGGGQVGQTLAGRLSADGHDVTLVESDPVKVADLAASLDVRVIRGNGSTAKTLRAAGVQNADLVVGATDSDECNLVVGLLAANVFESKRIVVRIHNPAHQETFDAIGGAGRVEHVIVNPESAAVDRIDVLLAVPGALDVVSFMENELFVAGFRIRAESDFVGLRVSDMNLLFAATPTLAVAIHRGTQWIVPGGHEEIAIGDLVYFAIAREDLNDVVALVGGKLDPRTRTLIAGAGPVGIGLAKRLHRRGVSVALIEPDGGRALEAAERLEDVLVIHGRPTDERILEDEEIEKYANFVAAGPDHESNLVAGLLAKRLGAGRAFVIVDNPSLVALVGEVGIDAIISPRSLTIGVTLQYVRGRAVRSAAALLEDRVEVIEVEAPKGSAITRGTLRELALPSGILVAALRREGRLVLPRGSDRVEPGDELLFITTDDHAATVTQLIESAPRRAVGV